jgi:hypothetical protein
MRNRARAWNTSHIWFRKDASGQPSHIDYIFSSLSQSTSTTFSTTFTPLSMSTWRVPPSFPFNNTGSSNLKSPDHTGTRNNSAHSLSTLNERGGALSPLALPPPPQTSDPYHPPSSSLFLEGAVRARVKMGIDGSTSGGCQQQQSANLTTMPSAAGRSPPPLHPVTSHILELYNECTDNGGWARWLYVVHCGMEKLIIIRKIPPAPTVAAPPLPRKPGRPASKRRRA